VFIGGLKEEKVEDAKQIMALLASGDCMYERDACVGYEFKAHGWVCCACDAVCSVPSGRRHSNEREVVALSHHLPTQHLIQTHCMWLRPLLLLSLSLFWCDLFSLTFDSLCVCVTAVVFVEFGHSQFVVGDFEFGGFGRV
jgi:hypothetical protein